jgi:hypothetical protein
MKCPQCGHENEDNVRCTECGHNLARLSPRPVEKKGSNPVIWIAGAVVILVIAGIYLVWFSSFFPPPYDCSVKEGYIDIQNDPHADVYLTLVDENGNTANSLYLPAGSSGTIDGICNGRFYLYYQFGKGWNPSLKQFASSEFMEKFDDPVDIKEYNYYDVSLVPGSGNAHSSVTNENTTDQK